MVEVTKVLAREWRNTGQDLKDKLRNDYDAKLEEYIKTKEKYYESMSDEQKARLIAAKSEGKIQKEKRLHKKVKTEGTFQNRLNSNSFWILIICLAGAQRSGKTKETYGCYLPVDQIGGRQKREDATCGNNFVLITCSESIQ